MVIEIEVKGIKLYYKSTKALDGVSLNVKNGEVLSIIGPNGAGKSTLLKVINRVLKPHMGIVLIDKKPIHNLKSIEIAKKIGYVPQRLRATGMLTVYDFVMTGRRPHINFIPTKEDEDKVYEILKNIGLLDFADRALEELSGGELQRVMIARALAGEPEVILFDEPTSNLDLRYQIEVLNLIRSLSNKGLIVIMALHDLTQAYRVSDKIIMLNSGKVIAVGSPDEVLNPELISKVYGIPVIIIKEHKIIVPLF
ncbi:MAG: ABC transporter ATP-binding protein [Candidatus Methanomethylicota archaeon]|jgi:iron complex transport system ATP-binding protein|uniref:ABC transporter ATP-binding protein n=1 Tax=Thermoproteota archaeon TaxID=2056631 RepID=A0A520KGN8_9CREN|nr:MAG: ABC transporter ATP-binding protein [Candidatus Verstraetearchaeota archaeon]TDA39645.1 MAG: ABC transporter ATP-binding protein [Candidatus Verstraetearchaeota archaeon]